MMDGFPQLYIYFVLKLGEMLFSLPPDIIL